MSNRKDFDPQTKDYRKRKGAKNLTTRRSMMTGGSTALAGVGALSMAGLSQDG